MGVGPIWFEEDGLVKEAEGLGKVLRGVVEAAEIETQTRVVGIGLDGLDVASDSPVVGTLGDTDEITIDGGQYFPVGGGFRVELGGAFGFADGLLDELSDVVAILFGRVFSFGKGVG